MSRTGFLWNHPAFHWKFREVLDVDAVKVIPDTDSIDAALKYCGRNGSVPLNDREPAKSEQE